MTTEECDKLATVVRGELLVRLAYNQMDSTLPAVAAAAAVGQGPPTQQRVSSEVVKLVDVPFCEFSEPCSKCFSESYCEYRLRKQNTDERPLLWGLPPIPAT